MSEAAAAAAATSSNKSADEEALVKKGLYVYFDNVEKAAKEENDSLKKYQRLHNQLTEIRLKHDGNELAVMQISDLAQEDDNVYRYNVAATNHEIEVDQAHKFSCILAGSQMESGTIWGGYDHNLYFDDEGNLKIDVAVTDKVKLIATLTGYPGSREDIEDIIDRNVHMLFFTNLGMRNAQTLEPITDGRDQVGALLGAVLNVEKLSIRKSELREVMETHDPEPSEHVKCLQRLFQAYCNHTGLRNAAALAVENEKLKMTRDYYQTVRFSGESGEFLKMDLGSGKVGPGISDRDGEIPSWSMKPPKEQPSIPLSSLRGLTVKLGGVTLYNGRSQPFGSRPHQLQGGFLLKDDVFLKTEIIFSYDDSFPSFYQEGDDVRAFMDRFARTIAPTMSNVQLSNVQYPDSVTELEGMTIKPAFIQIRLDAVRARLEELGIEVAAESADEST